MRERRLTGHLGCHPTGAAQSAVGLSVLNCPQSLPHAVSCRQDSQAGWRKLHGGARGAGGLSGLALNSGGIRGTGACPAGRGLHRNSVPGEPHPAHALVLALRQLWGDCRADRLIGKECVRPAEPYPKKATTLFLCFTSQIFLKNFVRFFGLRSLIGERRW